MGRGGLWDTRGPFFRILEEIPLLGYAVAVADFVRGDDVSICVQGIVHIYYIY